MFQALSLKPRWTAVLVFTVLLAGGGPTVWAQNGTAEAAVSGAATSGAAAGPESLTAALLRRMVARGAISKEDGESLIAMAEAEAAEQRAQIAMIKEALAHADAAEARAQAAEKRAEALALMARGDNLPAAAVAKAAPASAPAPTAADLHLPQAEAVPADTVRVAYVPEYVKRQLREQIRQDVMAQARAENWAAPRTLPDWLLRFQLFGDIRIRTEGINYPTGNVTGLGSSYWNYNAINAGSPYDYTALANPPYANVDQDRQRVRLRARLGFAMDLGEGFAAGIRLASGESNSPVTENQSLGASGGDFSKYSLWLDRAFLRYEAGGLPDNDFNVSLGRLDNPFFATSMIWADDLGFDGLAVQGRVPLWEVLTPFYTAGAFPVYNTDLNFATNQPNKLPSHDKWLYAGQLGFTLDLGAGFSAKLAAAYYDFVNVQGQVSSPYIPLTSSDAGNTDATRPAFAQKGNTYIALRNITPDAVLNNNGAINQWQYFGLASAFRVEAGTFELAYEHAEDFRVSLTGESVRNVGFDRVAIVASGPPQLPGPVNNFGANSKVFDGGNTGWLVNLKFGSPALQKRWDWMATVGYRKVDTDAVIDGFNDSDFGGGGTNLKGVTLSGSVALSRRVWLGLRWFSASQVTGPTYKNDVMQVDFNGNF